MPVTAGRHVLMTNEHTENSHIWVVQTGGTTCIKITAGITENMNCRPPTATAAKDGIQKELLQGFYLVICSGKNAGQHQWISSSNVPGKLKLLATPASPSLSFHLTLLPPLLFLPFLTPIFALLLPPFCICLYFLPPFLLLSFNVYDPVSRISWTFDSCIVLTHKHTHTNMPP